jgi:serine protease AprX
MARHPRGARRLREPPGPRAKRLFLVLLPLLLSLGLAQPASSAPAAGSPLPPGLADRDGNGISDDLQRKLRDAAPASRFDVVLTFAPRGSLAAAENAVGPFAVRHEFRLIRGAAATMTAAQIQALAGRAGVFRIEEDVEVRAVLDAARADFGADLAAGTYGVTGAGVGICVVDTGVDPGHEQLDNGKVVGWVDFVNNRSAPYDDHDHGTHVANIAAGDGVGGSADASRFRGVAPGASIYAAKVLDSAGSGTLTNVIRGVEWCADQPGVRVLSMSLGTASASDGKDSLSQAVNKAVTDKGKVAVVAAGNSGDAPQTVGSPGAAEQAITVGAVAEWSAPNGSAQHSHGVLLDYFSSRGPTLDGRAKPDVVAPGDRITAADAGTVRGYATYSGTSMATPFVSGAVALALDAGMAPSQVRPALEGTAEDWGPAGKDNDWGSGLVDVAAFVGRAAGGTAQAAFPTHTRVTGSVGTGGLWSHQFSLAPEDLGLHVAVTIVLDGELACAFWWGPFCLAYEWSPDLDARLLDPDGRVIAESTCAAGTECGVGRQETLHAHPTVAGTYTVQVYPWSGGDGKGGTFALDISRAPVGSPSPPPTGTPGAPTLSAGAGDGAVNLSWTQPSDGGAPITEYRIYRGTSSGGETYLATVAAPGTSYGDTAVSNGTTYYYQVSAVNANGEGPRSNEASATPRDSVPPASPTGLTATAGNARVTLGWNPNAETDLASYRVYRGTTSGGETYLATVPPSQTSYVDTAVANGTTYYYLVRAMDTSGNESGPSNEVSATPNPVIVGYAPSSVVFLKGSPAGDPLANLGASDDLYYRATSARNGKKQWTDYYGEFSVTATGALKLYLSFEGHYSRNVSQTLYVYNFDTASWVQLESKTVGTSDSTSTYATGGSPDPFISSDGKVRLRVAATAQNSFTSYGDRLRVAIEY